jgi:hypothetical protein
VDLMELSVLRASGLTLHCTRRLPDHDRAAPAAVPNRTR